MKLRRRKPQPRPPENVRVVYSDGRVVPVECVYTGVDPAGVHIWWAVMPVDLERGMSVTCDVLPAGTGVVVVAEGEGP